MPERSKSSRRTAGELLGHPIGLTFLALSEAWERFSFYGMQTLLTLYMVSQLLKPGHVEAVIGFPILRDGVEAVLGPVSITAMASAIFGLYAGAVYLTPILGGLVADRWLGRRRTIVLGALLMAAGHFLMAFEQPFLLALLCLVMGAGCFKGNIAAQVGALYAPQDQRRAQAFQVFYLGINGGAIAAPLVCGTLGEKAGWHYGFAVAGVGVLIGLAIYLAGLRHFPVDPPRSAARARRPLARRDMLTMGLLVALLPVMALGLVGNQQIGNAYLIWARDNANLTVMGRLAPVTWLFTLDTIATVAWLTLSVAFWKWWARRRAEPDELSKMILGTLFLALALLLLVAGSLQAQTGGAKVALGWLVGFHLLNSLGFATVLPVALAFYSRMAPSAFGSTIVGIYYLHLVGANLLIGWIGGRLDVMSAAAFWGMHASLVAASAVILVIVKVAAGPWLAPRDPHRQIG